MEELGRLFPAMMIFLVLGVPPIIYLFNKLMDEKTKNIERILTLITDFQKTLKEMENANTLNDGKLLDAINGVKSMADKLLDRSNKDV